MPRSRHPAMTGLYRNSSHSTPDATRPTTSSASSVQTSATSFNHNISTTNGLHYNNASLGPHMSSFFLPEGGNMTTDSKPARVRRKSAPGTDPIKHRRTRSGCFTCRTRRVKVIHSYPCPVHLNLWNSCIDSCSLFPLLALV